MKKKTLLLSILMCLCGVMSIHAQTFTDAQIKRIENKVKHYCSLLEKFSASPEGALIMDDLNGCCENNNVQTFDDLADNKNAEYNSVPLARYLMKITTEYDNELKVAYTGFKYERSIIQPAMVKDLNDVTYALVSVTKTIKGKGINRKVKLLISLNVDNNKVGGTVSTEYEDPGKMFQDGLVAMKAGETAKSIELFKKCASYKSYSGRYRAMAMLGHYYKYEGDYETAIAWLKQSANSDPLGGVMLANIYLANETPVKWRNHHLGLQLLEVYSSNRDKDYPHYQIIAKVDMVSAYMGSYSLPQDLEKAKKAALEGIEVCKNDTTDYGRNFLLLFKYLYFSLTNTDNDFAKKIEFSRNYQSEIDKLYANPSTPLDVFYRNTHLCALYSMRGLAYQQHGDFDQALEAYRKNLAVATQMENESQKRNNSIQALDRIAGLYVAFKKFDEAFGVYRQLAEEWNVPDACWYMYVYYTKDDKVTINLTPFLFHVFSDRGQKDDAKAAEWLMKACDNGYPGAKLMLAVTNVLESDDLATESAGVRNYLIPYCDQAKYNSPMTMQLITSFLNKMRQTQQYGLLDVVKEYTAKSGAANFITALAYSDDETPYFDMNKTIEYFQKGVELNHFYSTLYLANCYLSGSGVEKDTLKAEKILVKMTDRNYFEAYALLGDLYMNRGDCDEAFSQYQIAHTLDYDLQDCYLLEKIAEMYLGGYGTQRDVAQAVSYYELAFIGCRRHGDEDNAMRYFKIIEKLKSENPSIVTGATVNSLAMKLTEIADINKSPDARLDLSQEMLENEFATAKAVVEQVGTNGTTVVARLTAEDFLLQLATQSRRLAVKVIEAKNDDKGKLTYMKVSY